MGSLRHHVRDLHQPSALRRRRSGGGLGSGQIRAAPGHDDLADPALGGSVGHHSRVRVVAVLADLGSHGGVGGRRHVRRTLRFGGASLVQRPAGTRGGDSQQRQLFGTDRLRPVHAPDHWIHRLAHGFLRAGRLRCRGGDDGLAAHARQTRGCRPGALQRGARGREGAGIREPGACEARGTGDGHPGRHQDAHLLAPVRGVLRLWRDRQRADRNPSDPSCPGGGIRGRDRQLCVRPDGDHEHRRDAVLRLVDRPGRSPQADCRGVHAAGSGALLSDAGGQHQRTPHLYRHLRTRLVRHGSAGGYPRRPDLRQAVHRPDLRLDLSVAPDRRVRHGQRRRPAVRLRRQL